MDVAENWEDIWFGILNEKKDKLIMITFAYRSTSYLVYGSTLPLGKALPASR
jgi:hypothetical protein